MADDVNRRYLLRERPDGRIDDSTFELVEEAVPEPGSGQALVQNLYMSIDPTNRAWIGEEPTYLPPVGIGECMRSVGLGRVISSDDDAYPEGSLVTGLVGWQDYVVTGEGEIPLTPVPGDTGLPIECLLGALGLTGVTAYFGLLDIGKPQEGETVVVSAAAGAVGSVVGQIAKLKGAARSASPAARTSASGWSTSSGSTPRSIATTTDGASSCARPARTASTSTSRTSAARSCARCSGCST